MVQDRTILIQELADARRAAVGAIDAYTEETQAELDANSMFCNRANKALMAKNVGAFMEAYRCLAPWTQRLYKAEIAYADICSSPAGSQEVRQCNTAILKELI